MLNIICCPCCKGKLDLRRKIFENSEIKEGTLVCQCKKEYQVTKYIPRFVEGDNYTRSFTFDWYSPKFQSKHTHAEVFHWFKEAGLSDIAIFEGEISMSGTKI